MPKIAKELSALAVKRLADSPGFHAVGGVSGLYLTVNKATGRSWILRSKVGAKRKDIGIGGYPDVGLQDARLRAREIKAKIISGIDPVQERKAAREALIAQQKSGLTFEDAVDSYLMSSRLDGLSNIKHRAQWGSTLRAYAVPHIGSIRVSEITSKNIKAVLDPIWADKHETATRVRMRIEAVLTWATVSGHRTGENPARWKGNLSAPPAIYIPVVAATLGGGAAFRLGAQNVHAEKLGSHTGEVSLSMLMDYEVCYIIVGHSERRSAGETEVDVQKKVAAVIKSGLTAILCVGEAKRDHGAQYLGEIERQIRTACAGLSRAKLGELVIAYEPVWAIGTGNTATPDDVHEMKLFIEKTLTDLYGRNYAQKVRILYGGSVNPKNAAELMRDGMVDGFLVGGASLSAKEFSGIVKAVQTL